jgi:hypothetical protein
MRDATLRKQIASIYDGKHLLQLMPNGHKYLVDGEEKPGVTSIIALLNKPSLPQWAANQSVQYIHEHATPFPEYQGERAWITTETNLKNARIAFTRFRDNSADVGKDVHAWIEKHINSKITGSSWPRNYSKEMEPSITSFLLWEEAFKPQYLFSERTIYSEAYDYCGTVDTCIILHEETGDVRMNLDFKTGKPERQFDRSTGRYTGRIRPYNTVFLQNAMYDMAIEEEDGVRADRYGALYLSTNGDCLFGTTTHTNEFRTAARHLVEAYKAMNHVDMLNTWK